MSKSQRSLCVSFSRTDVWLCINHLFIRSNLNFFRNTLLINLPTQLCLVLYSFGGNFLHSCDWWLILLLLLLLHGSTTNLVSAFFLADLGRIWCAVCKKLHWFCSSCQDFELWLHVFFTFLFPCTHVWSILEEVGGRKMPCRMIVLTGNYYFNDKKYSGPIVLGDYAEKGSVWSRKTSKSSKNWCSITRRRTGLRGMNWCLAKKGTSSTTHWWTETEYSSHRCTSSSASSSNSPRLWTRMVTASFTCTRLFQDWPWRSWKLPSLTVLRSGSSSEIQSSKTQCTKCNWKRGRHLFW